MEMKKIAVLLTCHNRKEKTLKCIETLYNILSLEGNESIELGIYLTDDGSTDGTSEEVTRRYPSVKLLKANGDLFWTRGMVNSWSAAIKDGFDGYLLLNDDTVLYDIVFKEIFFTDNYSIQHYGQSGIYIGSTIDTSKNKTTYGGSVILDKFFYTNRLLNPNGTVQECDLGNGNIMFVSQDVVTKIGILSNQYNHAAGDNDYTLTAKNHKIPVLVMPSYCGECIIDHLDTNAEFAKKTLKERIKFLKSPKGIALYDQLVFMKKFFPYRVPFIVATNIFKLFFPNIYIKLNNLR